MTPLLDAIARMDDAAALAALRGDASLAHVRDPLLGSTPLHFAAHRGLRVVVDALLAAGADPHAVEQASGTTALHWAAEGGHAAVCARLLDAGARLDVLDAWFDLTPLGWATVVDHAPQLRDDRPRTVRHLLERGARHDVFTLVALGQDDDLALLTVDDPHAARRTLGFAAQHRTPLHVAAERGFVDCARVLLSAGADVNARTSYGETPLSLADTMAETIAGSSREGRVDIAPMRLLLVQAGGVDELRALDPAALAPELRTALLFACAYRGLDEEFQALVAHGADVTATRRVLEGELPVEVTAQRLMEITRRTR